MQQQQIPGTYQFQIGPQVLDLGGNSMNQDGDEQNGEVEDIFQGSFQLIDVLPPAVTLVGPNGYANQPVEEIRVCFAEPIVAATFGVGDLSLYGPNGEITLSGATITPVPAHDAIEENQEFVINIGELTIEGLYQLTITNHAADLLGNVGTGETFHFEFTLDTTRPTVVSVAPQGPVGQPVAMLEIHLSEPIQAGSLAVGDLMLSNPLGAIAIQGLEFIDKTTYRIHFAQQATNGDYTLVVAPNFRDLVGNTMEAAYRGVFSIKLPDFAVSGVVPSVNTAEFGSTLRLDWRLENTVPGRPFCPQGWMSRLLCRWTKNSMLPTSRSTAAPWPLARSARLPRMWLFHCRRVSGRATTISLWRPVNPSGLCSETDLSNNTAVSPNVVTITFPELPDMQVFNVAVSGSPQPGGNVVVAYNVSNASLIPAVGNWTERVYLSSDDVIGNDLLLSEFSEHGQVTADPVLRQRIVTIPQTGVFGDVCFVVQIDTSEGAIVEQFMANNFGRSPTPVNISSLLTLSFERNQVRETDGQKATRGVVSRYGDISSELTVSLNSADAGELSAPVAITLPAGVQSVPFWADASSGPHA